MRNDELRPRHDAAARIELGCPPFAAIFSLGAALELIEQVGIANIQERALQLNRFLTDKLIENTWKVLSPIQNHGSRSAETLIETDKPADMVRALFRRGVIVTEKPEGFRAATHFFNDESDVERLIAGLNEIRS
jgi:selenocysteine lyase/cysteine desulfurase